MKIIQTLRIPPPAPPTMKLFDAALSHHYGYLESDGSNQAFIPEFIELRDLFIPAWHREEHCILTFRHVTTLLCILKAFETLGLNRYRGDRTMQRAECTRRDPEFLDTIKNARSGLKRCTFTIPPHGSIMVL